jgi:putative membrane protein
MPAHDRVVLPAIALVSLLIVVVVGALTLTPKPANGAPGASVLPPLNAALNATSAILLTVGYAFIRRRRVAAHLCCMITAFAASSLFLVSYVAYHYQEAGSRAFAGTGWVRAVYLVVLVSHIVLAAVIVPLALTTIYRAWQGTFDRHRRIARWTLPVWLYVSVTGVVVYWMLYHLVP